MFGVGGGGGTALTIGSSLLSGGALGMLGMAVRARREKIQTAQRRDALLWGEPARGGVPAQPGLAEQMLHALPLLSAVDDRTKQLERNGGRSVADKIHHLADEQEAQGAKLDELHSYAHDARHAAKGVTDGQLKWNEAFNRKLDSLKRSSASLSRRVGAVEKALIDSRSAPDADA